MDIYNFLHQSNIVTHVIFGSAGILLGLIILISSKATALHQQRGRFFLFFLGIVIMTGLIGSILFRGNMFLLLLTLTSGYSGYSGFRIIRTKSNRPFFQDILVGVFILLLGGVLIVYLLGRPMMWSPIVIYSTYGSLFLMVSYDLLRYLIPSKKYLNLWLYEHIYKMVSCFTALVAAASGNILPESAKPFSQILPSLFGTLLAIGFIIWYKRKSKRKALFSEKGNQYLLKRESV